MVMHDCALHVHVAFKKNGGSNQCIENTREQRKQKRINKEIKERERTREKERELTKEELTKEKEREPMRINQREGT